MNNAEIGGFIPTEYRTFPETLAPEDDCGVLGLYDPRGNAFEIAYPIHTRLDSRGTDSSGLASWTPGGLHIQKGMGRPSQIEYEAVKTTTIIGHNRYTTYEGTNLRNAQPARGRSADWMWDMALAHNGNLDGKAIWPYLETLPEGNNDSALAAQLIAEAPGNNWLSKILSSYPILNGSFSMTMMTSDGSLFGFTDLRNNRPLWIGEHPDGRVIMASETYAIKQSVPDFEEFDVHPLHGGELALVGPDGKLKKMQLFPPLEKASCVIEGIYLMNGKSLTDAREYPYATNDVLREDAGRQLGIEEHYVDFKAREQYGVSGIPNGGNFFAKGYAKKTRIDQFIILNKIKDARSFIQNGKDGKKHAALSKLEVDITELERFVLSGKTDLVLVDDSMIRGTMLQATLQLIREACAKREIPVPRLHIRPSSPRVLHECGLGIALDKDELFYNNTTNPLATLGVDSIQHLSIEGLLTAFTGRDGTGALDALDKAYVAMGFCFNCMRDDGKWQHPFTWYQQDTIKTEYGTIYLNEPLLQSTGYHN